MRCVLRTFLLTILATLTANAITLYWLYRWFVAPFKQ